MLTFELRVILTFLVAFFGALFVMPNLSHIANRIGLVDVPNDRKMHTNPRPLVGGIGIVIATTFSCLVFVSLTGMRGFFAGLSVLLLIGFFDDFIELGHGKKFLAQIIATTLMIFLSKVQLTSFGNLLGIGVIQLPHFTFIIWLTTIFCVVGVTNAVNMIDGIDGLAGGVTLVAFLAFAVLSSVAGYPMLMLINLALAGGVLGFLTFNWAPAQLFMGDAGSLCLGFALSFMAVALTQGEGSIVHPVIVLLVLAVPITDTLVVMIKRIRNKRSPFKPDRTHLHHLLVGHGIDGQKPVKTIILIAAILSSVAIAGVVLGVPDYVLFGFYVCYFIINWNADLVIGKTMKVINALERQEKPRRLPSFFHSFYHKAKHRRVFRAAIRYEVDFPMEISCRDGDRRQTFKGRVINISKTGFKAYVDELGFVCRECVVTLHIPMDGGTLVENIRVEHLRMKKKDDGQVHGFRFLTLTSFQRDMIRLFVDELAGRD